MEQQKLPLTDWAARQYAKPPTLATLRRWVREGKIYPAPELHGRAYVVEPEARYLVERPGPRLSLVERMGLAA